MLVLVTAAPQRFPVRPVLDLFARADDSHLGVGHHLSSGTKMDPIFLQSIQNNTSKTGRIAFFNL